MQTHQHRIKTMLSTEEYLQKLIDSFELINANELVYLINCELRVIYMSKLMLDILNKQPSDVLGKYFLEVSPVPDDNALALEKSLQQILENKQSSTFLSINSLRPKEENRALTCIQTPYIHNDQVVAISLQGKQISMPIDVYSILMKSQLEQTPPEDNLEDISLSHREQQIIFLLIHCKNSLEIAQVISTAEQRPIGEKTVRNIISRQLFKKFQVEDQKQLINKLRQLKYHKKFPDNLFNDLHVNLEQI